MYELFKLTAAALVGGLMGIVTAVITARLKIRELERQFQFKLKEIERNFELQRNFEKERETAKIKIQYLNPLRVSAKDLLERIKEIRAKLADDNSTNFLKDTFHEIKSRDRDDKGEFARWCNGFGHYSMSTIYVTAVYYAHASKIRLELPFIDLDPKDDQALLDRLSDVRKSFGGELNLWETIQDSVGTYMKKSDGAILNYREFCEKIIDESEHIWFLRLIDFYRDIHMKPSEVVKIEESLTNLTGFLKGVARPVHDLSSKLPGRA